MSLEHAARSAGLDEALIERWVRWDDLLRLENAERAKELSAQHTTEAD